MSCNCKKNGRFDVVRRPCRVNGNEVHGCEMYCCDYVYTSSRVLMESEVWMLETFRCWKHLDVGNLFFLGGGGGGLRAVE